MSLAASPTTFFLDAIADAIEALDDADLEIGLFTGSPTLGPDTVLADLTPPAYTGYAREAVAFGARRGNANGDIILPLPAVTFQPTANTGLPITVTGWMLVKTTGTPTLLMAELLDDPWEVVSTLSALDINEEVYITADPVYGGYCSTCST